MKTSPKMFKTNSQPAPTRSSGHKTEYTSGDINGGAVEGQNKEVQSSELSEL